MFKLFRYLFSGGVSTAINMVILFVFTHFIGFHYLVSGVIAFCGAVGVSFYMQKKWTFEDHSVDNTHAKFSLYVGIALLNLGLNTFLLYFFTDICGFHYLISQILASGLIAFWSYFAYAKMFKKSEVVL